MRNRNPTEAADRYGTVSLPTVPWKISDRNFHPSQCSQSSRAVECRRQKRGTDDGSVGTVVLRGHSTSKSVDRFH